MGRMMSLSPTRVLQSLMVPLALAQILLPKVLVSALPAPTATRWICKLALQVSKFLWHAVTCLTPFAPTHYTHSNSNGRTLEVDSRHSHISPTTPQFSTAQTHPCEKTPFSDVTNFSERFTIMYFPFVHHTPGTSHRRCFSENFDLECETW